MSNEEDKIANWSPKLFKGRKPYEYGKKIETMDIDLCDKELSNWKDGMSKKEELQDDIKPESDSYLRHDEDLEDLKKLLKEDSQDDEPLTLINAQSKGHFS
jgi:hypothetical protein